MSLSISDIYDEALKAVSARCAADETAPPCGTAPRGMRRPSRRAAFDRAMNLQRQQLELQRFYAGVFVPDSSQTGNAGFTEMTGIGVNNPLRSIGKASSQEAGAATRISAPPPVNILTSPRVKRRTFLTR